MTRQLTRMSEVQRLVNLSGRARNAEIRKYIAQNNIDGAVPKSRADATAALYFILHPYSLDWRNYAQEQ